jgi:hypothetical protein
MKYMGQIQISRRVQVEDERTNSETLVWKKNVNTAYDEYSMKREHKLKERTSNYIVSKQELRETAKYLLINFETAISLKT